MSKADEVRAYCAKKYVEPARTLRVKTLKIKICVGDVHSALGYENRLPLVCSAIGTKKFEKQFRLRRLGIAGPLNGATTVFTFAILE